MADALSPNDATALAMLGAYFDTACIKEGIILRTLERDLAQKEASPLTTAE